jgi:hypothetical protein
MLAENHNEAISELRHYYFEAPHERLVEGVSLGYASGWYSGKGVLEWDPANGFMLRAFVDHRSGKRAPMSAGRSGLAKPGDSRRIRLRFGTRDSAITSPLMLVDRTDIAFQSYLRIRFHELFFFERKNWAKYYGPDVSGRAVLSGFLQRPRLPDSIERTAREADGRWSNPSWSRSALSLGHPIGFTVRSRLHDEREDILLVNWKLKPRFAGTGKWSQWPAAFARALSFVFGTVITVVESEARRPTLRRRYVRRAPDPVPFGPLRFCDAVEIDKDDVRRLTRFFYQRSRESRVAELMIDQIAAAAQQVSLEATQLLVATVLEAALRTIQSRPFVPGARSTWNASVSLNEFRRCYLSDDWTDTCGRVLDAWNRLRHRNAHPTWLVENPDAYEAEREVFSDMMLLSRFYGTMIIAMAGKRNIPLVTIPRV